MRKYLVISSIAVGLLVLGAACAKETANTNAENENASAIENSNESVNTNTTVSEDRTTNSNTSREDSNTNSSEDTNTSDETNTNSAVSTGALTVSHPEKNKELETPFEVSGKSSASSVYARVKNAGGTTLFTETVKVRNGEFEVKIAFEFTHTTTGTVEVFEKDAAGSEVSLISIPVTFKIETSSDQTNSNTNSSETDTNTNESTNTNS